MMRAIRWGLLALFLTTVVALADITGGLGPGLTLTHSQTVYPETFGALGNGVKVFDGAVTGAGTFATAVNSGTALSAPAVTTANANDWVISIFNVGVAFATPPTLSNTRVNVTFGAGAYGMLVGDQVVASPGAVSAISSTLNAGTASAAATIALQPNGTISFIAQNSASHASQQTISVTEPAGLAVGDYEIACFAYYITSGINLLTPTNSTGWSMIYGAGNLAGATANPATLCMGKFATASEPATYTFLNNTGIASTGFSAAILAYRGVAGVEAMNQTLTSATAGFNSTMVGWPICVAGEMGNAVAAGSNFTGSAGGYSWPQQVCGTITAVNSAASIQTSFYLPYTQTAIPVAFGHDDTTALNSTFSSPPCSTVGCTVQLGMKHYVTTGLVTVPQHSVININGSGAAVSNTANNWKNTGGPPLLNYTGGSGLLMLSYNNSQAALVIGSYTAHNVTDTVTRSLSNFYVTGGVGNYSDGGGYGNTLGSGGGTDGIDIISQDNIQLNQVMVTNFAGDGVYFDACCTAAGATSWIANGAIYSSYIGENAGCGVQLGSASVARNVEPVQLINNLIEGNGQAGICIAGPLVQGFSFLGNTLQWDNSLTYHGSEFSVTGVLSGGDVRGNYFEADVGYGSHTLLLVSNTAGAVGLALGSNFYNGTGMDTLGMPYPLYSAAGTAVPAAGYLNVGAHITVTDATACTAGSTYASGGSTQCVLVSNGTNWLETGQAWQ